MLERVIARGVNLQTNTPVTSINPVHTHLETPIWTVNTTRGSIRCNKIIHATNGYSSALVPELQGKIVPVKGMVAHLVPTDAPRLAESYMMRFSDYEYDYLIPRPDGSIIVGGARRDFYKDFNSWFDVSDDGSLIGGAENYFEGYMQRHFHGWEDCDVRAERMWTGSKFPMRLVPSLIVETHTDCVFASSHGLFRRRLPICGRGTRESWSVHLRRLQWAWNATDLPFGQSNCRNGGSGHYIRRSGTTAAILDLARKMVPAQGTYFFASLASCCRAADCHREAVMHTVLSR